MTDNAQQKYNEWANLQPVLVTGATGRIGRAVVAELLAAGVPVRALTRNPATAALPARTFGQWVLDHADAFRRSPAG